MLDALVKIRGMRQTDYTLGRAGASRLPCRYSHSETLPLKREAASRLLRPKVIAVQSELSVDPSWGNIYVGRTPPSVLRNDPPQAVSPKHHVDDSLLLSSMGSSLQILLFTRADQAA